MRAAQATWNPSRDVWEAGQTDLFSGLSGVFSETFPKSGSMRSGQLFERPTLVPPTVGRESSSSHGPESTLLLRTPCAQEAGGGPLSPSAARRNGQTLRLTGQIIDLMHPGTLAE